MAVLPSLRIEGQATAFDAGSTTRAGPRPAPPELAIEPGYYWIRHPCGDEDIGEYGPTFHYGKPGWLVVGSEAPYRSDECEAIGPVRK
jgi:hypothetical protein